VATSKIGSRMGPYVLEAYINTALSPMKGNKAINRLEAVTWWGEDGVCADKEKIEGKENQLEN